VSNETEVIGGRVSPDRRDELEQYVKRNGYDSVPSLFRRAVAHEMDEDYGLLVGVNRGAGSGADPDDDRVAEVLSILSEQNANLANIQRSLSAIQNEMENELPDDRKQAMENVYTVLPDGADDAESTDEIASRVDQSETAVRRTLADLQTEKAARQTADDEWFKPR
jgi:hypothetical protein